MSVQAHQHSYKNFELYRIMEVTNSKYNGLPGATAFIYKVCSCGSRKAHDFGKYQDMQEVYDRLAGQEVTA